jgi:hypothetical protein
MTNSKNFSPRLIIGCLLRPSEADVQANRVSCTSYIHAEARGVGDPACGRDRLSPFDRKKDQ